MSIASNDVARQNAPTNTSKERYEAQQRILEHLAILEWALLARLGRDSVECGGAQRLIGEVIDDVEVMGNLIGKEEEPKSGPVVKDGERRITDLEQLLEEVALVEEEMASTLAQLSLDAHNLMSIRLNETGGADTLMRQARAAESMTVQISELFRHAVSLREFARCGKKKVA